jgi:hypothetical protein
LPSVELARRSGGHHQGGDGRECGGDADEAGFHRGWSLPRGAAAPVCIQDFGISGART